MKTVVTLPPDLIGKLWLKEMPRLDALHQHDELECNLVVSGSGAYLLDGRRVDLRPFSILWLFPEQEHLLLDQTADFKMWIFVIKPSHLSQLCTDENSQVLLARRPLGSFLRHLTPPQFAKLVDLCAEVTAVEAQIAHYNAGLGYLLLSAWAAFQMASVVPLKEGSHPAVVEIARYIHAGGAADDLQTVAQLVDLTPETVSRLFKRHTGLSLTAFRNLARVDRFLALYGAGHTVTMLEAALAAGFGSYAQFYRVFRQVMQMTPAVYRRRLQE